jgi:hypothetical protein
VRVKRIDPYLAFSEILEPKIQWLRKSVYPWFHDIMVMNYLTVTWGIPSQTQPKAFSAQSRLRRDKQRLALPQRPTSPVA